MVAQTTRLNSDSPFQWLQVSKLPARLITRLLSLLIGLMILATASAAMAWLERGDSGDAVSTLQNRLTAAGCYNGPISGNFGSLTQEGVIQCQLKYGLAADGIVGPKTMAALEGSSRASASIDPTAGITGQTQDGLQRGSRGEQVIALQRQLKTLALYEGEIDGIFGAMTEAAVAQFQSINGLVQTGVFGELERKTIAAIPAPIAQEFRTSQPNESAPLIRRNQLTLGDGGKDVEHLQARLKELKYFDSTATGYYGELTKSAVSNFQSVNRLPASGVADSATLQALGLSASAQTQQPQSMGFGSRVDNQAEQAEAFNNSGFDSRAFNSRSAANNRRFTDGFNNSSFTAGNAPAGTPIGRGNLGTADVGGRNRFVVIIPKRSGISLNQVRQIVPDATEGKSSIGEFIQVGAFSNQQLAEEQSRRLQAYNWDARVAYR